MGLRINPWQRAAASIACLVCLWAALSAYLDEGRIGVPFLGGSALLLLSLSRPMEGDSWFPPVGQYARNGARFVANHRFASIAIAGILTASVVSYAFWQNQIASEQQKQQQLAQAERDALVRQQEAIADAKYHACMANVPKTAHPFAYTAEWACKSERQQNWPAGAADYDDFFAQMAKDRRGIATPSVGQ